MKTRSLDELFTGFTSELAAARAELIAAEADFKTATAALEGLSGDQTKLRFAIAGLGSSVSSRITLHARDVHREVRVAAGAVALARGLVENLQWKILNLEDGIQQLTRIRKELADTASPISEAGPSDSGNA